MCCAPALPKLHNAAPITPFLSHGRSLFVPPGTVIAFLTMGTLFITYYNPQVFFYNSFLNICVDYCYFSPGAVLSHSSVLSKFYFVNIFP